MAKAFYRIVLFNGVIPLVLTNNPAGILDFITNKNEHKRFGTIFRTIGGTLRFVKEGRDYLNAIFDSQGVDGVCDITFEKLNNTTHDYDTLEVGIIDFNNTNDEDPFFECGIIDNSDMGKFIAREEIEVNVFDTKNIDDVTITNPMPATKLVTLTPINFVYSAASVSADIERNETETTNNIYTDYPTGTTEVNRIGSDFDITDFQYTNNTGVTQNVKIDFEAFMTWVGSTTQDQITSIPFTIKFDLYRTDTNSIFIQYRYLEGSVFVGVTPFDRDQTLSEVIEANILPGDSFGLKTVVTIDTGTGSGSGTFDLDINFSKYDVAIKDAVAPHEAVECESVRPIDLGTRILEQMGIDTVATPLESTVLGDGGEFENIMLTNGRYIRGYPSDTPLNISFSDFFESYSNVLGLILYYNGSEFRIEQYGYRFDDTPSVTITDFADVVKTVSLESYFSRVLIGYKNNTYEETNGNIEFNTEFEFATNIGNVKNTLNKISEVRADSMGIELLRRQRWEDNGDEDVRGEEDLFFISAVLEGGEYRAELGNDLTDLLITPYASEVGKLYFNSSINDSDQAVIGAWTGTNKVKYLVSNVWTNSIPSATLDLKSWSCAAINNNGRALIAAADSTTTPYTDNVWYSEDGGATFDVSTCVGNDKVDIALNNILNALVVSRQGVGRVQFSIDGGATFTPIAVPLDSNSWNGCDINDSGEAIIVSWAGTNRVKHSIDGGATWLNSTGSNIDSNVWLSCSINNGGIVLIVAESGSDRVQFSINAGASFNTAADWLDAYSFNDCCLNDSNQAMLVTYDDENNVFYTDNLPSGFIKYDNFDNFAFSCAINNNGHGLIGDVGDDGMSEFTIDSLITGLRDSNQYYNFRITPKQNLTRHGILLNTCLRYKTKLAKYIRSKNEIPLVINGLAELDGDYLYINSVDNILPVNKEFQTILTDSLRTFLVNTPNEKVSVNGEFFGFIKVSEFNEYSEEVTIKLIESSE